MIMQFKKWLGLVAAVVYLGLSGVRAQAADADYTNALNSAPQGIAIDNIFTPGTTANNKATVVDTTNAETPGTQAVMVTNDKNQFGTIWSTDENAFDLDQDEVVSMWMYFGDKGKKAADGMAFVLQNDSRGIAATPTFGKKISGETLGVWAVDANTKQTDPNELAKLAIQNSWALEFDTHLNTSDSYSNAGDADSFDVGLKGPHLASNYPAVGSTYSMAWQRPILNPILGSKAWYAHMNHEGLITGDYNLLANGAWHHVTLKWSAAKKQMTYIFDDKDPKSGQDLTGKSQTVTVDPAIVDPNHTGKIRWGFTGATGSDSANNLVIFEGVPGLVDVAASSKLTNLSTDEVVNDGDAVLGKDKLQLDYKLTYNGGKQDWKDVRAKLTLPERVNFNQAKVTYANGDEETIDASTISDQKLNYQLKQALSTDNPTATITLTGTAADEKQTFEVPSVGSTFSAVNGVTTTDTSDFILNPQLDIQLLRLSNAAVTIDAGKTTTIKGQVFVPEGITLTNKDLIVHPTVNGQAQPAYTIDDPDGDATGQVLFTPAAGDLKPGENTVEIYVKDIYGNKSNTITVKITVTGGLSFDDVAKASSFQQTKLTGKSVDVKRDSDWSVKISDTRQAGSKWHLQVAATPFTDADGDTLAGSLIYRNGSDRTPITTATTTISSGQATGDGDLTDVVDDWNDTTGLELNVNGNAVAGDYATNITWTLSDTP